jgi:ketosteroid isomerase-like protein
MSRENLELIRRGYEAWNSGDAETALAMFALDVEILLAKDAGAVWGLDLRETYHGIEGFMQFLADFAEAWDEFRWEPVEYHDLGDQVLVFIHLTARGRGSGIELDVDMAHLCDVRMGKLVRHETFMDRSEALEAVGLRA